MNIEGLDEDKLNHLKQHLDHVIVRLKESVSSVEKSSEAIKESSEKLYYSTTKVLSHVPIFEEMGGELISQIQESITESLETAGNKLAGEIVEFIKANLIDTINGLNKEIKDTMDALSTFKLNKKSTLTRSFFRSSTLLAIIWILSSIFGGIMSLSVYMKWVIPHHQLYYDYGKTWNNAFEKLTEKDKKIILDMMKRHHK
jgi:DNA-directed RNA polymerase subunit F